MLFCAKNNFSSHLATMAIGSANPDIIIKYCNNWASPWKKVVITKVTISQEPSLVTHTIIELPHDKTKTKWHVRPVKTQIILGICRVWSEPLLCAQWVAKDPCFLQMDSKVSDQTGWMPRLIWVFTGCTGHFVGFVVELKEASGKQLHLWWLQERKQHKAKVPFLMTWHNYWCFNCYPD